MTSEQRFNGDEPSRLHNDIVFYGGMGAGKTTAAMYLVETHGYEKVSFADPLKAAAAQLWGPDAIKKREILQPFGVAIRAIDEDTFVNLLPKPARRAQVNDDMRFPNEYWSLKKAGFKFVRILAKEEARVDRLMRIGKLDDLQALQHESETALVGLKATQEGIVEDYTIFNDQEPSDLYQQIENVLVHIEEGY